MKKDEYIQLLITDNGTSGKLKKLYDDIIDCVDIALSQTSVNFEIDSKIGLHELYKLIQDVGTKSENHCVGPFEAAELIARHLGTKYTRKSRKFINKVNLEDFFDD